MKNNMKRLAALILALLLLPCPAYPEDGETVTEKDGWHFDAKGFLTGDNPGEEYILEDAENGYWQYASRNLSVKITRVREQYNKKKIREYCVAEIWASEDEPLQAILTAPKGKWPEGVNQVSPELLVQKHPCIFAMSDDYYGSRQLSILKKNSGIQPGIIIRNGEIRREKTKKTGSKYSRHRPCLDVLAVYGDGSMKTYYNDALTAQEYLDQGVVQTFAFGPWLISEGKINEKEAVEGCGYYEQMEPLCGLGMIEPYHYIAIMVRGRPKEQYAGVRLSWLADRLLEQGCVEALNLDGGGTACMYFNGKVVIQGQPNLRSMGSMIAFGLREEAAE